MATAVLAVKAVLYANTIHKNVKIIISNQEECLSNIYASVTKHPVLHNLLMCALLILDRQILLFDTFPQVKSDLLSLKHQNSHLWYEIDESFVSARLYIGIR